MNKNYTWDRQTHIWDRQTHMGQTHTPMGQTHTHIGQTHTPMGQTHIYRRNCFYATNFFVSCLICPEIVFKHARQHGKSIYVFIFEIDQEMEAGQVFGRTDKLYYYIDLFCLINFYRKANLINSNRSSLKRIEDIFANTPTIYTSTTRIQ